MTLFAVLAAVWLERLIGYLAGFRRAAFERYAYALDDGLWRLGVRHAGLRLGVVLLAPVAAVGWTALWLSALWLGLPWLGFAVAMLFLSLGPEDLEADLDAYVEAVALDEPLRQWRAASRFMDPAQVPETAVERARAVAEAALAESNRRLFAPMFWFIVFGPAGAVCYRLTVALAGREAQGAHGQDLARLAAGLGALLDWAPARLALLGYALTGSFEQAVEALRRCLRDRSMHFAERSSCLLRQGGAGALQLDARLAAAGADGVDALGGVFSAVVAHVHRNVIAWLTAVALLTLGTWLT